MQNILSPIESSGIIVANYDTGKFPFRKWFEEVIESTDLERLHKIKKVNPSNFVKEVSVLRELVEARFVEIKNLQTEFLQKIAEPFFGPIASRQEVPTARFHFNVSEPSLLDEGKVYSIDGPHRFLNLYYFEQYRPGVFHRDRDYGLIDSAINVWIPITDAFATNSLWLGTSEKMGVDAEPIELEYGQCVFFNGAERWHGAVWNTSGITRVSFDIRFLPSAALVL